MRIARNVLLITTIVVISAAGVGCKSTPVRTKAVSEARDADMLGSIKQLEGKWIMADENGSDEHAISYRVTAGNSAVEEVMFAGSPYEMVNLYHMDGPNLVVTHYCASGNQPRMIATTPEIGPDGSHIFRFKVDSVSNLRPDQDNYMGGLVLTFKGDSLKQEWTSFDRQGNASEHAVFELKRAPVSGS